MPDLAFFSPFRITFLDLACPLYLAFFEHYSMVEISHFLVLNWNFSEVKSHAFHMHLDLYDLLNITGLGHGFLINSTFHIPNGRCEKKTYHNGGHETLS